MADIDALYAARDEARRRMYWHLNRCSNALVISDIGPGAWLDHEMAGVNQALADWRAVEVTISKVLEQKWP